MIDDTLLGMMLMYGCGAALIGLLIAEAIILALRFMLWMNNLPVINIILIGTKGI